MADPFIASVCTTEVVGHGRFVHIGFDSENGNRVAVDVPTSQFASVAHIIQMQADSLGGKKKTNSILGSGEVLTVDGFRLLRHSTEGLVLTVFARLFEPDGERHITIPLVLPPQDAETLRLKLERLLLSNELE